MVTRDGVACLADFAISGLITNPTVEGSGSMAASKRNLLRYMTPEQIKPSMFNRKSSSASKESDVHCFAMTVYEVRSPASRMTMVGKFTPLLGPHGDPAIRRQKKPRPTLQAHFRRQPSASAIAGNCGPLVTRLGLGNDRVLLGLISMGAVAGPRSPSDAFAFCG